MLKKIFITATQLGYTDSSVYGPFNSIEEGKRKITDGLTRGLDGDETRYTFFEMKENSVHELGYVLFKDECCFRTQDIKEENFYI